LEYEIVYLEADNSSGGLTVERQKGFLGGWAAKGWELITVVPNTEGAVSDWGDEHMVSGETYVSGLWFYFKRVRREVSAPQPSGSEEVRI
jgi:hypothetical protein